MGKFKSHQATKKRIKITGGGKMKREKAKKSHLLEKKSSRKKQNLRKESDLSNADKKKIKKVIIQKTD